MQYNRLTSETALADALKNLDKRITSVETRGTGPIGFVGEDGTELHIGVQVDGQPVVVPFVGDITPPPVATAPIASSGPGFITVVWDGLFANAEAQPADFTHLNVIGHKVVNGVPTTSVNVGMIRATLDSCLVGTDIAVPGETWEFGFTSQDYNANVSVESAASERVVQKSFAADALIEDALDGLQQDFISAQNAAASAQQAADAAQDAADAAALALTTKGKIYTQSVTPSADPNGLWIDTGHNNVPRHYLGTGTALFVNVGGGASVGARLTTLGWTVTTVTSMPTLEAASAYDLVAFDAGYAGLGSNYGPLASSLLDKGVSVFTSGNDTTNLPPLFTGGPNRGTPKNNIRPVGSHPAATGWAEYADGDLNYYLTGIKSDAVVTGVTLVTSLGTDQPINVVWEHPTTFARWTHVQTYASPNSVLNAHLNWIADNWIAIQDQSVVAAIAAAQLKADQAFNNAATAATAAGTAQTTADSKNRSWYQDDQPAGTSHKVGDSWYDTNDGYKLRTWTGTIWQTTQDSALAQLTADSKGRTYTQNTTPPVEARNDKNLWIDTSAGPGLYVTKYWDGNAWTALKDKDAKAAQDTADAKGETIYSTSEPAAAKRLPQNTWIDTSGGLNIQKRWDGFAWVVVVDSRIPSTAAAVTAVDSRVDGVSAIVDTKADTDWVLSRGTDLVTNGSGLLGNNTNFSTFVYNVDAPMGAVGSFDKSYGGTMFTDESIPVDVNKKYLLRYAIKQRNQDVPLSRFYSGLSPRDAQDLTILPENYAYQVASSTTLTSALNPGDTVVNVGSTAGWTAVTDPSYNRFLAIWNWVDPSGKVWPVNTYTRNLPVYSAMTATTLTLSAPYAGPAMPSGTPVANTRAGGNYMYVGASNQIAPLTWGTFSGTVGGLHNGANGAASTAFPPGTASVKLMWLLNYSTSVVPEGEIPVQSVGAVSFSDATAASADAAAAQAAADSAATSAAYAQKATAYSNNPSFDDWTSSVPNGYTLWAGTPYVKDTTNKRVGPHGLQMSAASSSDNRGIQFITGILGHAPNLEYYTVEVEFMLTSGTSLSGAGVLLDWNGLTPYRTVWRFDTSIPGTPVLNKWYRVSKTLKRPAGTGTWANMGGFLMANYSETGTLTAKTMTFDWFNVRPATTEEILSYTAPTTQDLTAVDTRVTGVSAAAAAEIDTVDARVTGVSSTTTFMIDEVDSRVTSVSSTANTQIGSVDSRVTGVSAAASSEIGTVDSRVTGVSASTTIQVGTVNTRITSVSASVTSVDSRVTGVSAAAGTQIGAVDSRVTSVSSAASAQIGTVDSRVTGVSAAANTQIGTVDSRVTTVSASAIDATAKSNAAQAAAERAATQTVNKLVNPSFEAGLANWTPGRAVLDATTARSGVNSARVDGGTGTRMTPLPVTTPVVSGQKWRIGVWYKTTADYNGTAGNGKLRWGDQTDVHIQSATFLTNQTNWTWIEIERTIGASETAISPTLNSDHTVGKIWFDEVEVRDVTELRALEAAAATAKSEAIAAAALDATNKVTVVDTRITSVSAAASGQIGSVDSRVTGVSAAAGSAIGTVDARVTSVSSTANTQIGSVDSRVTSVSAGVTSVDSRVTGVSAAAGSAIGTVDARVTGVSSAANSQIGTVDTRVTSVSAAASGQINTVDSRVTGVSAAAGSAIGVVDARVTSVSSTANTQIGTVDTRVTGVSAAASGQINTVDARVTGVSAAASSAISTVQADIDQIWASSRSYINDATSSQDIQVMTGVSPTVVTSTTAMGGKAIQKTGTGNGWWHDNRAKQAYDPTALYRLTIRVRTVTTSTLNGKGLYFGFAGLAADGTTFVNATGANSYSSQQWAQNNTQIPTDGSWTDYVAYYRGLAPTTPVGSGTTIQTAKAMHADTRYVVPSMILDYSSGNGTWEVSHWSIDVIDAAGYSALIDAANKSVTYYQDDMPSGGTYKKGDIWIDTNDGNKIYAHNGTTFVSAQDTAITSAATSASAAMTAANGKNKLIYNTTDPSGTTGYVNGDTWFKRDAGTGVITGQWEFISPNWVWKTLDNNVIANLNAGKLTAGTLDAGRIGAYSLTANKIAVGDFTNLFSSPQFASTTGGVSMLGAATLYAGTDVPVGNAAEIASRDHVGVDKISVRPGDQFYIEYTAKKLTGTAPLAVGTWVTSISGGVSTGWSQWSGLNGGTPVQIADLGNGWARYSVKPYINLTWAGVSYAQIYFQLSQFSPFGTNWAISDVVWRRRATGELLVDGAIKANSAIIETGAIGNAHIGDLNAGKINAGTLHADRLSANDIRAKLIAADTINAVDIISSGSISSSTGVFGVLDASSINAGTIGADRLDANTIRAKLLSAAKINAVDIIASGSISSSTGVFGVIDASSINAGTLSAARIGAGSITASALNVTMGGNNLVYNSSFEVDSDNDGLADGWNTWARGAGDAGRVFTNTRVAGLFPGSIYAQRVTSTTVTNTESSSIQASQLFAVKEGDKVTLSLYIRASVAGSFSISMRCEDDAGVYKGDANFIAPVTTTTQRFFSVITIPTGTTKAKVTVTTPTSLSNGHWFEVDGLKAELGDVLSAWSPATSELLPGTINATMLTADAINGKVITGATIQTNSTPASAATGIKLTPSELAGYGAPGVKNFSLTSGGTLTLRGALQSGSSIEGASVAASGIYTNPSPTAGVKLSDTGIKAYNGSGALSFHLDATTGLLEVPGLKANAITSAMISATALDARTITGSTIQSETHATRGLKLTSTELAGFDGTTGNKSFSLTSAGALYLRGEIKSGSTIEGAKLTGTQGLETSTIADTGVKINNAGIKAYDSGNNLTFHLDAGTGMLEVPGLKANSITGDKVAADTISTRNLLVTDMTNHVENPLFETGTLAGWTAVGGWYVNNASPQEGTYKVLTQYTGVEQTLINNAQVYLNALDKVKVKLYVWTDAQSSGNRLTVGLSNVSGGASENVQVPAISANGSWVEIEVTLTATTSGYKKLRLATTGVGTGFIRIDNVRLFKMGMGNMIVDGAITTDHMTSGTIDGGVISAGTLTSTQIKAKSILADDLVISSTDNLVVEADFGNNGSSWDLTAAYKFIMPDRGRGGLPALRIVGSTTEVKAKNLANKISVDPKNRYRASFSVRSTEALAAGKVKMYLRSYSTAVTSNFTDHVALQNDEALVVDTWKTFSAIVPELPSGTLYVEVIVAAQNGTDTTWTEIDFVSLTRAMDATLVVDGSITAAKIDAEAINASHLAANSITASALDVESLWTDESWLGEAGASSLTLTSNGPAVSAFHTYFDPDLNQTFSDTVWTRPRSTVSPAGLHIVSTMSTAPSGGTVIDEKDVIKIGAFSTNGIDDGDDYFSIDKNGISKITMNSNGDLAAQNFFLGDAGTPGEFLFNGDDIGAQLRRAPRGIVAWGQFTGTDISGIPSLGSTGGDVGMFEIGWDTSQDNPDRMYNITMAPMLVNLSNVNTTTGSTVGMRMWMTTDGSRPAVGVSQIVQYQYVATKTNGFQTLHMPTKLCSSSNGNYIRILFSLYANCGADVYDSQNVTILINDLGEYPQESGIRNTSGGQAGVAPAPAPAAPVKTTRTTEWGYTGVRSYTGTNAHYNYNTAKAYQGLSPAGYGNLKSQFIFPNTITSTIAGSTINGIWLYVYFEHWYYGSGGTARFRLHGNTGLPTTYNGSNNGMNSTSFPRAAGRWVAVPSSLWAGFLAGTWKGFGLDGDNTYGTYGIANNARIRITYTK